MITKEKKSKLEKVNEFLDDRRALWNRRELKLMRHHMTFWVSPKGGALEIHDAYTRAQRDVTQKGTKLG